MNLMPIRSALLSIALIVPVAVPKAAASPDHLIAQTVIPSNDGTNTQVDQTANKFVINGGTQTGANLFHSFQQFGLESNQTATFLSTPNIQAILGRVTGGDASLVDGLLQVTGSSADLYLINPAGLLFGENAQLDLSGSFIATTADGLQFGTDWFDVLGDNDYASFTDAPTGFAFSLTQPGSVVNQGDLTTVDGEQIVLLGGNILNTGIMSTPGGDIYISAVPGEKLVSLTQAGHLISFDLPLEAQDSLSATSQGFNPVSLPQLLTGGGSQEATELLIEGEQIQLISNNSLDNDSNGVGNVLVTQRVDASTSETSGGNIQILGERIGIIDTELLASGTEGGTIEVGGSYRGEGPLQNANRLYVNETSNITANAGQSGTGGNIVLWADDQNLTYGSLSAQGGLESGDGGLIEVSSRGYLAFRGQANTQAPNGENGLLLLDPVNIIIRNGSGDGDDLGDVDNLIGTAFNTDITVAAEDTQPTIIYESELEGLSSNNNVRLEATNDITIEDLDDDLLALQGSSGQSVSFLADVDRDGSGQFSMNSDDTIQTQGARLEISAAELKIGNIKVIGFVKPDEDAGQSIEAAFNASNTNNRVNISSIEGLIESDNDVDIYRIYIADSERFSANVFSEDNVDTQLFLFDGETSFGLYASDNTRTLFGISPSPNLELNEEQPLEEGFYYLAISSSDNDPISDFGEIFPDLFFSQTYQIQEPFPWTRERPLASWNNEGDNSGRYSLRLEGITGNEFTIYETPRVSSEVITLEATSEGIQIQSIDTTESTGAGIIVDATGDINVTGSLRTVGGDISVTGSTLELSELDTDVREVSRDDFDASLSYATRLSQAGNVTLVSQQGDITVDYITAFGDQFSEDTDGYRGGDVFISSQGLFRAVGTIGDSNNVSINTSGFGEVGNVTIQAESLDGQFVSGVSRQEIESESTGIEIVFEKIANFAFLEGQSGIAGLILSDTTNQSYISSYTDSGLFSGNEFEGEFEVSLDESSLSGNINLSGIRELSEETDPITDLGTDPITDPGNDPITDPNTSEPSVTSGADVQNLESARNCTSPVREESTESDQCVESHIQLPISEGTILKIHESVWQN